MTLLRLIILLHVVSSICFYLCIRGKLKGVNARIAAINEDIVEIDAEVSYIFDAFHRLFPGEFKEGNYASDESGDQGQMGL